MKAIAEHRSDRFDASQVGSVPVEEVRFDTATSSGVAWTWYAIGDSASRSGFWIKAREAADALLFRRSIASGYVVVARDESFGHSDLRPALERVAAAAWAQRIQ